MRSRRRAVQSALAFYAGEALSPSSRPRKNSRPEAACLVEVKAQGGWLSGAQSFFLDRVRAAGGVAFVASSAADVTRNLMETP